MSGFEVDSFQKYLDIVRDEIPGKNKRLYYRGQSKRAIDGYTLKPSLGRYDHLNSLSPMQLERREREVLQTFSNHLLTYIQIRPLTEWEQLAIAQHHLLPTRFMDFTTNPLVALYFAVRNTKQDKDGNKMDSAVYVLINNPKRYSDLTDDDEEDEIKPIPDIASFSAEDPYADFGIEDGSKAILDALSGKPPDIAAGIGKNHILAGLSGRKVEDFMYDQIDAINKGRMPPRLKKEGEEEPSPFDISENIIYDPPHVSPRIRAQDGVLMACYNPLQPLDDADYIEIVVKHEAHDDIRRRLCQYGVFDKQLFPDLDGIAKWLKYQAFEINGVI